MQLDSLWSMLTSAGGSIVLAIVVFIVGKIVIGAIVKGLNKGRLMNRLEGSIRTFSISFVKIALYVILVVSVIGILGVPMASVVTVLASAGVAIGLALQGALSNLAGGIMVMVFRPFKVGDYVEASGAVGTVQEITMFYTVFLTVDNVRVTVPNGSLMNGNISNYSAENFRRVDLTFTCAKSESPAAIQDLILKTIVANPKVLPDDQAPAPAFARLSGGSNEAMEFTLRAWCNTADYWDVYFDLTQQVTEAFAQAGIQAPALRVVSEAK